MAIAKLERIKARALRVGDKVVLSKDEQLWPSSAVHTITPPKAKLVDGERQTPAHRMKVVTEEGRFQVLPTADVFILPRKAPKPKRRPRAVAVTRKPAD